MITHQYYGKMRILVLNPYMSRRFAGASNASITIANRLSQLPDTHVVAYAFVAEPEAFEPAVDLITGSTLVSPRFFWRFPSLYLVDKWARQLRAARLPPVDVCFTRHTALALAYRRVFPSTPIVSHTGAVLPDREYREESGRPAWETAIESYLVNRLERRAYAEPAWSHVVSTHLVARQRERHYGLRRGLFSICPLPVDGSRFNDGVTGDGVRVKLGIASDAFLIVTVARLTSWKNISFLLRAMAGADEAVHLAIVGTGPDERELRSRAQRLGLSSRVTFVGHANPAPILAASDLFVLPSVLESFGLAYAEAMTMGLPCIGMRNNPPAVLSTAEDVIPPEAGFTVSTESELAQRINEVVADPSLRDVMGRQARRHASRYYVADAYVACLQRSIAAVLQST
jgi:glycosyltransferase involved in cell wall biosynthesis